MKYAFILGSNSYIVPGNTLIYSHNGEAIDFLSITSIYHDRPAGQGITALAVDLDIKDIDGNPLKLQANNGENTSLFKITEDRDRLLVTKPDGTTVIDVHQLDDVSAMKLEHNIIAELEVHSPVAVIRIRGNFMINDLHIEIDNEKVFVNGNSYANSTLAGKTNLQFTDEGVVI
ncbi:hypothetical protein ACPPVU_07635 [Mucilaginibacter sp. McL0603]|uniref:hypothetical protein n=1 Tax=Mucilaginibacter sp. McL0603 TaxID=3415670 RepID=UPI003CEA421C